MYTVYVLKSKKFPKTYVGCTNNIERRLQEHNGRKHTYTKRYVPWEVVYTEEELDRQHARQREIYLKSGAGRRWLRKNVFEN